VSKSVICSMSREYYFSQGLSTILDVGFFFQGPNMSIPACEPVFLCYNAYI
jgi:hypothetical protein